MAGNCQHFYGTKKTFLRKGVERVEIKGSFLQENGLVHNIVALRPHPKEKLTFLKKYELNQLKLLACNIRASAASEAEAQLITRPLESRVSIACCRL